MTTLSPRTALALALATSLAASCSKKQPDPPAEPEAPAPEAPAANAPNAADTYKSLFETLAKAVGNTPADASRSATALAASAADIQRVIDASRAPHCDFGIDRSKGLDTMLPHIGPMRGIARAVKADAERALAAGDVEGAAERAATLLRLANHLAQSPSAILEPLTAAAIAKLGLDFITANPSLARANAKGSIIAAMPALTANGMFHSTDALKSERDSITTSLRNGTGADLSTMGGKNWNAAPKAERDAAAAKVDAIFADAIALWETPGATSRLNALNDRATQDGIADFVPPFSKVRTSLDDVRTAIGAANTALR